VAEAEDMAKVRDITLTVMEVPNRIPGLKNGLRKT
jgi:hypothetical protein